MRKLVAALACRNAGSRLYGKPMQNLDIKNGVTILGHLLSLIETVPEIKESVLGISEGTDNEVFKEVASHHNIPYIVGSEKDVLLRLIECGRKAQGTDVFRVTTESPFFHYEVVAEAWAEHVANDNDVTVIDFVPEGSSFEIYKMSALIASHERGDERHRSEFCSLYCREHQSDFNIQILPVDDSLNRLDLRLTVDHPEDLVLCRQVYEQFAHLAPEIPLSKIISFLDGRKDLLDLVAPFTVAEPVWADQLN